MTASRPGRKNTCPSSSIISLDPLPTIIAPLSIARTLAIALRSSKQAPSGYICACFIAACAASSAFGEGPYGFSLEASLAI